jgi:hypothetical protein
MIRKRAAVTEPDRWTNDQLVAIDDAYSLILAAETAGSLPGDEVEIGMVVVDGEVFVRAYRGSRSRWFQAAQVSGRGIIRIGDTRLGVRFALPDPDKDSALAVRIDSAYASKYGDRASGYGTSAIRAATLRILPAGGG